ncbi:hypothetical protein SAMN05216204_14058, partial [Massilia yuzhufengensis]
MDLAEQMPLDQQVTDIGKSKITPMM